MSTLHLPSDIQTDLIHHAQDGHPAEVVGVLGGTFSPEVSRVKLSIPATNDAHSPTTRYAIADTELLSIVSTIEERGHEVVGFYHSHPSGPLAPSHIDEQHATWDGYSYVIVVPPDDIASWRWDGSSFIAEDVVTPPESLDTNGSS